MYFTIMQIKDGWFEEQEDGTRDYITVLENGEVWRLKNVYPVSVKFDDLETTDENVEITITQRYAGKMDRPKVGVAVAVCRDGKVLLGLRQGGHASGRWGFVGGHLEGGESFEQCAKREALEEAGIALESVSYWTVENVIFNPEQKHFVTIFMIATLPQGQEPQNLEPSKCSKWQWFSWDELPNPLMPGIVQLIEHGFRPM